MHLISNLLYSIINAYSLVIFVYVIMSWLPNVTSGVVGQVYRALGTLCDPYLNIFKKFIPPIGMLDVSPILALIVLQIVGRLIVTIL